MLTLQFLLAICFFSLPGLALWLKLINKKKSLENIINGICFSYALSFFAIFFFSYLNLNLFLAIWIIPAVWAIRILFDLMKSSDGSWKEDEFLRWLFAVFLLAACIRFLPVYFNEYPHGWDPYFHLLLTEKILQAQTHIYDWLPFEDIPLHYPIGTHLFVASLTQLTRIPSHIIFKFVMAFFGTMTCVQIFSFIRTATSRKEVALFATAAYSFMAFMGSLDYYGWGGFPNLMAVYFLLGCLTVLMDSPSTLKMQSATPLFFAVICFSNHHTLATSFFIMLVILFYFLMHREKKSRGIQLAISGMVGGLLSLPCIAQNIFPKHSLKETGLLLYREELHTLSFISHHMGHFFLATTVLGAILYFGMRKSITIDNVFKIAGMVLILLFIIFEYGFRLFSNYAYGQEIAPFTPGRFLTDAISLLCLFSGVFFWKIKEKTGLSMKWMIGMIFILSLSNISAYKFQFTQVIAPEYMDAYQWIKENTSTDTIVLDEFIHAPLLTQRVSFNTPIPTSELWGKAKKRNMMRLIANRQRPPESAKLPVVYISQKVKTSFPDTKVLWRHPTSRLFILELYDGVGF